MFRHFTLTTDDTTLVAQFTLKEMPPFTPKFNIAPGDQVATIPASMDRSRRIIGFHDWGLIFDEKDVAAKENRACTVDAGKLSTTRYESLFRFKRCLILADGLYVWQKEDDVPRYFVRSDRQPFAFAGIRERFSKGDDSWNTCAIITISLNGGGPSAQAVPALVTPEEYDKWISPMVTKVTALKKFMIPLPVGEMESRVVGDHVKNVHDKLPHCTEPRT
jgi:putative SOS response-associated peptidase YedK